MEGRKEGRRGGDRQERSIMIHGSRRKGGRKKVEKEGRAGGRKRKEGCKEGRKKGRREVTKERREGRQEGKERRKERRKERWNLGVIHCCMRCIHAMAGMYTSIWWRWW